MKYMVLAIMLMATIMAKFLSASFRSGRSFVPIPNPSPRIGPIRGEINIAPIMTGIELRFNPTDAMTMAQVRMKTFWPLKKMPFLMEMLADSMSIWSLILTKSFNC